jgi:GMP synthase (glutamine-hydrolysing)
MRRSILVVRHVAFENLGFMDDALAQARCDVAYIEPWALTDATALIVAPILIVLGGPLSANNECAFPFLTQTISAIGERVGRDRPTLGVCLGAQIIARSLGARVYRADAKELGLGLLDLTTEGRASCLGVFDTAPVLHWRGENFDLPAGAMRLASTFTCPNQAFTVGLNVLGVQFHPEAAGMSLEPWLVGHCSELEAAGADVSALREAYDL